MISSRNMPAFQQGRTLAPPEPYSSGTFETTILYSPPANAMAFSIGYGSRSSLASSSTSVNLKQSSRSSLSHRCPTWKEDQNRRIHRLGNHGINPVPGRPGPGTSYLWRYYRHTQQNHWREQAADRVNSRPAGLFNLRPELGDENEWDKWANRVICLRKSFKVSQNTPTATHTEVRKAITIAGACFGNDWDIPVAIMLLALQRRQRKDPIILNGFAAMFAGKY